MGKIIISDNASLDGVIQDPAGDEGFRVGGWVGAGERLFGETSDKKPMRLINARILGDNIVFLTYEPVRDA